MIKREEGLQGLQLNDYGHKGLQVSGTEHWKGRTERREAQDYEGTERSKTQQQLRSRAKGKQDLKPGQKSKEEIVVT